MMRPDNEYTEPSSEAPASSRDTYESISGEGELKASIVSQKQPQAAGKRGNKGVPSSFDPYSLNRGPDLASPADRTGTSLLDNEGDDSSVSDVENATAGVAGLLEMEPEPSRTPGRGERPQQQQEQTLPSPFEPIRTSSGLLLTHRRTPNELKPPRSSVHIDTPFEDDDENEKKRNGFSTYFRGSPVNRRTLNSHERFEVENSWSAHHSDHNSPRRGSFLHQARRILSVARLGVVVSGVALFLGTLILMHAMQHERTASSSDVDSTPQQQQGSQSARVVTLGDEFDSGVTRTDSVPDRIILVPFQNYSEHGPKNQRPNQRRLLHSIVSDMRTEFESWATHHGKVYPSHTEKEKRFSIWADNHQRTMDKNELHGPCKLTQQPVFGANHFTDLTHDEFKSQFLSKSRGLTVDQLAARKTKSVGVLGPHIPANHHPEVHRRITEKWTIPVAAAGSSSSSQCKWYDASCILRYIYNTYFYGFTTIMEPAYDANSYPSSVDWRDVGAVTEVHSQGSCGACWAITAVESVESAIFLSKGKLYDLSETEVIVCADDCEMCYGGWPQDAFDYIMDNKGIPLEKTLSYDGDWLLKLSAAKAGESDELSADTVSEYTASVCPEGGSHDSSSSSSNTRYGNIDGYGYSTDRCTCYTDGSGCNCDSQNEGLAVRNLATYGPAVVCLDASVWQDYTGGIITSASGCSQSFLAVNHCVQAVGYAYMDSSGNDEDNSGSNDSGSGDNKQGNQGSGSREGYWIIRNQWSTYWGMNGYAYVAMGENTCGILNDMLQVYA